MLNSRKKAFGKTLIALSIPSAIPVPAIGYSTIFGVLLFIVSLQMIRNKHRPIIPKWAENIKWKPLTANKLKQIRERIPTLFLNKLKLNVRTAGILVSILALVMMIPLPFTNTLPAIGIMGLGVLLFN